MSEKHVGTDSEKEKGSITGKKPLTLREAVEERKKQLKAEGRWPPNPDQPLGESPPDDPRPKYKAPKRSEVYRKLADVINNKSFEHQNFLKRFFVSSPEIGSIITLEEHEPGLARIVNVTHLVCNLLTHLEKYFGEWRPFQLDVKEATNAINYWIHTTKPEPMPKMIAQKSDPEICFHRLPWDYENANEPTPFFDEFIGRCTNSEALKCFLGSLFEPLADRSQYLWIWGDGGDGKGTLTTMLSNIFGPICCSPGIPVGHDKFWAVNLHKKKLAIISECETASFLTSALFKAITGNDAIQFENKGEKAFSEKPDVRVLFSSNNHPHVTRGKAHERRLISSYISPPILNADGEHGKGADGVIPYGIMNALWWAEAPSIVNKCLRAYRRACPTFGPIPTDSVSYENALDESEVYLDGLFHNYFELDKNSFVAGAIIEKTLDDRRVSFQEKRNFRNFLKTKYGLQSQHSMHGKIWKGIKKKVISDSDLGF